VLPPSPELSLLKWHRLLEENGIVCAPREGMLRFSPHFYNVESEIDRVIDVLRGAAGAHLTEGGIDPIIF
jgi:selenocysteine lyase/cysteine desulfurase